MLKNSFFNTKRLLFFNLKKDKRYASIWIVVFALLTLMVGFYYVDPSMSELESSMMVESLSSPAMILLVGVAPEAEASASLIFALEMTLFCAVVVAIMNIFLVARNTRDDEENGRLELIRSMKVGRLSPLASVIFEAFIVNLALGLFTSLGLCFVDFGSNAIEGALVYGSVMAGTGFLFACFTAIFAQIFQSNRTVIISSFALLFINYLFRGVTDISYPKLSWISPLSWTYKTEVYVNNHWFPVLLMLAASVIAIIIALGLNSLRDIDGSFIKQKAGRRTASKFLLRPLGLTTYLNKTTFISWIAGIAVLGATLGSILGDLEAFFSGNDRIQAMFPNMSGDALTQEFIGMIATIMMIVIAIPLLTFIGKIYGEEKKNHMENIISKKITKTNIMSAYLIYTLITCVILVLVGILSVYAAGAAFVGFSDLFKPILVFVPVLIFMVGLGCFIVGAIPKLFGVVWLILGYAFFITYFGQMLKMPKWLMGISPFYHIPILPVQEFDALPLIILSVLGVVLAGVGFVTYNKRDITA